jgi:transcriptional regulatory protein RtcR
VSDVRKIWPPPSPRDPSMVSMRSSLHAHDLAQRVHDLDQMLLRVHDRVDRLVRRRRLVDDAGVLAALDALRRLVSASRERRTTSNDADRLRKYLARFGLTWSEIVQRRRD